MNDGAICVCVKQYGRYDENDGLDVLMQGHCMKGVE